MPTYVSQSACAGVRPPHLVSLSLLSRPAHVSRLLRERRVPRFIVAPAGSGKTSLALDYAETVFSLRNVFWLDGKSPCFLRDLDNGTIARKVGSISEKPFLLVVDDVPVLDSDRAERFEAAIDAVIDAGGEMVVACAPDADVFARQTDRVLLDASDLLLSDDEFDALAPAAQMALAQMPRGSRRVAGFAWGAPSQAVLRLELLAAEVSDPRERLSVLAMLLLGEGGLDEWGDITLDGEPLASRLRKRYPLLGVEEDLGSFESAPFAPAEVHRAFRSHLAELAFCCEGKSIDGLAERVADRLMAQGRCERACGVAQAFLAQVKRAEWLARNASELLDQGCLLPASDLFGSLTRAARASRKELLVDQEVRSAYLEFPPDTAEEPPDAPPFRGSCDAVVRLLAQVARFHGRWMPETFERAAGALEDARCDGSGSRASRQHGDLARAHRVIAAASQGCACAASEWLSLREKAGRSSLLLLGAWVLEAAAERKGEEAAAQAEPFGIGVGRPLDDMCAGMVGLLCDGSGSAPFPEAMACRALGLALESGLSPVRVPPGIAQGCHGVELGLYDQRRRALAARAEERRDAPRRQRRGGAAEGTRERIDAASAKPWAPVLTVNLFGGLDVSIGSQKVSPQRFARQKTKTLLALLVLNRGHELTRDKLVELLWPESSVESGRRNLYCNWSSLKKALSLEGGGCPYLVRQQQALSVDSSLMATDLELFDDVCHALLFEKPGYGGWAGLHGQLSTALSGELLPSEESNLVILRLRSQYRDRLVDALVCATNRLVDSGSFAEALWFGRMAVSRDASREDAYVALMRAQIGAGQRKPAMDTYFSCRRYLADNLGINPSLETINLYNSVILSEEPYGF